MPIIHKPLRYAHDEGYTDVCYSQDGSKFITCGTDGDIRIWSTQEGEDPVHKCIGEWALSVRQKDDNLYVATGNNDVQILSFPEGESIEVLDRFVAPINHIAINQEFMSLASDDMEVKLINMKSSEKEVTVFTDFFKGPCLASAFSPNSEYLAVSCGDGKLRIFHVPTKELIKEFDCFPKTNSFANAKSFCRMDFEPSSGKYLAYPERASIILLNITNWSQVATLTCKEVTADYSIVQYSPCGGYIIGASIEGDFVIFNTKTRQVHQKSKHSNATAISGIMWNPQGNGEIVYTDMEGQLGLMSGCITNKTAADNDFNALEMDFTGVHFEEEDDDDGDSENVFSVEKLKKDVMGESDSELNFDDRSSVVPTPRSKTPEIPLQDAFMPSSTPEHLNCRYLCWNKIGVIRSYGEDEGKSIEVEFSDSSFHNSIMLQNYQDYIMGSLSKSALVLANANQLTVIPLSVRTKEWCLKLENTSEEIVLVTTSENLVCFATNLYFLRICSIFGTQRGVISIPGPVVSMSSYQNYLLVAYHTSSVRKNDQCIAMKLIKCNVGLRMEGQDITSALSPESTLQWLGFTDVGNPAIMDSQGCLNLYLKDCNLWLPFCNTSKHLKSPSDGFFVTTVMESCQTLFGIKCKGSFYPAFTPRPTICELKLEPEFVEATTEKTQMEMNLFAWSNLQVKDINKQFIETGLKTFALACKANLDQRAVEFLEIIANPQLINLSTKYALKLNKKILAEKLMEMAYKLNEDEDSFLNSNVAIPDTSLTQPIARRVNLSSIKKTPNAMVSEVVPQAEDSLIITPTPTSIESPRSGVVKNPFLKNSKNNDDQSHTNPLSLTNQFAGVDYSKENKVEKRKQPESDEIEKRLKEKQRKLNRFMFTKGST